MARAEETTREFQLETRHLAFLIVLVVALCLASFMLGRWVERQNRGPSVSELTKPEAGAEVADAGDVAKDLTFFDSLKTDRPAPLETVRETASTRPSRPEMPVRSVPAPVPQPPAARPSDAKRSVNEGVMIQVFASKDRGAAESIRKRLRSRGYTALLVPDGGSWKVRVGPYADREEAERSAAILRQQENLKTWIP
jgi:cell division septation protein DedD